MKINVLSLKGMPIFDQLQIEEALLRTNDENWCLLNYGSPPAIVLGISAKVPTVVDNTIYQLKPVPVIRRFTGGGTVFIDENTIFVTFILNQRSFPDKVLQWSQDFYKPVFGSIPFQLRENDYVIGEKKIGGNAQYFQKSRFLHHTSFLYDYAPENMKYLLFPPKTPKYREGRDHTNFLTNLAPYFSKKDDFVSKVLFHLSKTFIVENFNVSNINVNLQSAHRKTTNFIKIEV